MARHCWRLPPPQEAFDLLGARNRNLIINGEWQYLKEELLLVQQQQVLGIV